jgi:hypothetical protein
VHLYRNVFSLVPSGKVRDVARMLKAIHAQEGSAASISQAFRAYRLSVPVIHPKADPIGRQQWITQLHHLLQRVGQRRSFLEHQIRRSGREAKRKVRSERIFNSGRSGGLCTNNLAVDARLRL